jgi:hypothetical protein
VQHFTDVSSKAIRPTPGLHRSSHFGQGSERPRLHLEPRGSRPNRVGSHATEPDWSPDGTRTAYGSPTGISFVTPTGVDVTAEPGGRTRTDAASCCGKRRPGRPTARHSRSRARSDCLSSRGLRRVAESDGDRVGPPGTRIHSMLRSRLAPRSVRSVERPPPAVRAHLLAVGVTAADATPPGTGSGLPELTHFPPYDRVLDGSYSPDGKSIVFATGNGAVGGARPERHVMASDGPASTRSREPPTSRRP